MEANQSMNDQFLSMINRIIGENFSDENFSVEKLAEEARLSRSMLHRKLVKLTGKSATEYIMEIRLNRAKELLENDVATISEIAYKVGFNSTSYFHRVFKKRFKVSPGDFKKNSAGNQYQHVADQNLERKAKSKSNFSRLWISVLLILLTVIVAGGIVYYILGERKPPVKSIAILPFDNLSSNEENQYFADGIVEDLLNRLSKIEDLKVISRTSSEMFRDKGDKTVSEIAEILGVKYILEGSVQRETDKVRISMQLIDAIKDDHVLSKQYDRKLIDVFKIQGDIASQIVKELSILLSEQQLKEIRKIPTQSPEAMDYYHIGRFNYCYCTYESVKESTQYFKKAIATDSTYALPYAHLALSYRYLSHTNYFTNARSGRDSAEILACKALEIDHNLAEAHAALAYIYWLEDLNFNLAEKEYLKALRLNPNSTEACKKYADFLNMIGEKENAREYIDRAIRLDPLDINARNISTVIYMDAGNFKKALEENRKGLEIAKDHPWALSNYYHIYRGLNDDKAAYESVRYIDQIEGKYPVQQVDSAFNYEGIEGVYRLKISRMAASDYKADGYCSLGEYERAIDILELMYSNGRLTRFSVYKIQHYHPKIKTYPRFNNLLKKMGLEDYLTTL